MKLLFLFFSVCLASNLLFTSIKEEFPEETSLQIIGKIPDWVEGTLYRNGFGKFEGNGFQFKHIFDALALILKFRIDRGEVFFQSRMLNSHYYRKSLESIPTYRTFGGINPNMTLIKKSESLMHGTSDNYNANLIMMGPHLTAVTDMLGAIIINDDTLEYFAKYPFNDGKLDMISSAHPFSLSGSHLQYNYKAEMVPEKKYKFYYIDTTKEEPYKREYFFEIEVDKISYIHSFGSTDKYIIFVVYPFYWNIEKIITEVEILPTMIWVNTDKTKIYVINKNNRRLDGYFEVEPFFSFHHINSYEKNNEIYFDMIVYNDSNCLHDFYLKNISDTTGFIGGNLRRFRLDLVKGRINWNTMIDYELEMPSINNFYKSSIYKYFYAIGSNNGEPSIVKVSVNEGKAIIWSEKNHFPSEPIFIANENDMTEDNGVVVSVVLDEKIGLSYLLMLDAKNMEVLAKAYLNISLPMSCHGIWIGL